MQETTRRCDRIVGLHGNGCLKKLVKHFKRMCKEESLCYKEQGEKITEAIKMGYSPTCCS